MHTGNQFDLLRERRFAPFFWTQFLGAANDNVYKNALIIFVAFHAARLTTLDPNALVNLAGAVFIAPFVLLLGDIRADRRQVSRSRASFAGSRSSRSPSWSSGSRASGART